MYENAIHDFFSNNTIHNFNYYLHEYSYGRFVTYLLRTRFPKVKKIGFQHAPASRRRLLYYLGKSEPDDGSNNFLEHLPMPDEILAEDEQSKRVYIEAGYKNVSIMPQIYRLKYLNNIERKNVRKNTILVACGLHDSTYIFEALKNEMIANADKKYIFKLHPRQSTVEIKRKIDELNASNVEIAVGHISDYFSWVSEVVVTYSSVGYEAYLLNIPVKLINLPNKINESPLLDIMNGSKVGTIS